MAHTSPEAVGFSSERLARIRPVMQSYVDRGKIAGISTMLARNGKIIHSEQVGKQDRDTKVPISTDTIYRIYSMTKPIVCVALMTLYEEGRFQLFDPVAKYLPAFASLQVLTGSKPDEFKHEPLQRPVLMKDLFTHTAGFSYNFLLDSPVSEMYRQSSLMGKADISLEAMIAELVRLPLAYQPGSRWHYSLAIDVIAHLVEVISGQPLRDFLAERMFKPLGMADTAFAVPANKQSRVATIYGHPDIATSDFRDIIHAWQQGANERIDVEATYPLNSMQFARGGHGLYSTIGDYMRFAQMLCNRGELDGTRILSPKIADLMHMNHLPARLLPYELNGIPAGGYGFGLGSRVLLNVADSNMPGSVGEFGWGGAAKTYYWVDPKEQIVGVYMSQSMMSFEVPDKDFQVLAYQALIGG
jgi:CubicO group peptidase (beta-lactamase class C family)